MTYDDAGNMLTRKKYSYTTGTLGSVLSTQTLTYGDSTWGDLLTGINGTTVTSDVIGNVLNDGTWTYTWKNGRQLATMSKSGVTWNFAYDASGMRTQRTNGSTTYNYTYDDSTLVRMTVGNNTLIFTYGINGYPVSVNYNGTDYYYVTNAFGDVVGIATSSGTEVVTYTYDAWGNILSTGGSMASTLGAHNPLRYRGYVYDQETGLYYLQSRYYNPAICRFISSDNISYLGIDGTPLSYNLFAYCGNNPIMGYDPTGHWDWNLFGKILVTTVIVAGCLTGVGAIAAAAAAATATSVTAAVTVSVATAGVSTALSAVDGAICAQKSGGKWYDGAMAGAIGGSAGALVSSITNPTPGTDTALRMNTAGRVVSSLLYDVSYDLFSTGRIKATNVATYAIDVTMDAALAPINYYYTGSISNGFLRSSINGLTDGAVDVFQTITYFAQ